MTYDKDISYMEFIERISKKQLARKVKLVDLKHNSDFTRLEVITDKDIKRIEKHKSAIRLLEKCDINSKQLCMSIKDSKIF